MNLSKDVTNKIYLDLDQLLIPIIRDSKLLCKILIRLQFKNKTNLMMMFKQKTLPIGHKEFFQIYKDTARVHAFFLYPHRLLTIMKSGKFKKQACLVADGDLFYYEDKQ